MQGACSLCSCHRTEQADSFNCFQSAFLHGTHVNNLFNSHQLFRGTLMSWATWDFLFLHACTCAYLESAFKSFFTLFVLVLDTTTCHSLHIYVTPLIQGSQAVWALIQENVWYSSEIFIILFLWRRKIWHTQARQAVQYAQLGAPMPWLSAL